MPGETKLKVPKPKNPTQADLVIAEKPVAPEGTTVVAQFKSAEGDSVGPPLNLPADISPEQLQILLNSILENEDPLPYSFFVDATEIISNVYTDAIQGLNKSTEETLQIVYQPQAIFRVRSVTRCSSSMPGHTEAVLCSQFSPDGSQLATGSGDTTVRVWDLHTETPQHTLKGHTNWVQVISWSPDGQTLATGSMDKTVRLWNPKTGMNIGAPLKGHTQCITSIAWEPFHLNPECTKMATGSRDGTVRVWNVKLRQQIFALTQHTAAVTCIRWGGEGLIYTSSRDKSIKVWCGQTGKLVRSLEGHAHWVNHLTLSTEWVLRTGPFGHEGKSLSRFADRAAAAAWAKEEYEKVKGNSGEKLVSCSDDFTMFLWSPNDSKNPVARMTGHQQPINHVSFSPNTQYIASASFDKSIKLWSSNGNFITSFRGHVGAVYSVCWSADSRMIVSGSKDSTLKLWDLKTKKLKVDLPGHADEVFSVDWSPEGSRVASGGRDRVVKIWKN